MHIVLQTIALLITNNIFFEDGIENTRSTDALDGIIDFSLNFYYHLVE